MRRVPDDHLGGLTAAGFTSGSTYSLDFFASALGDPASGVQAHVYLGTQTFTGGTTGSETFTSSLPLLSSTETVTATAALLTGPTLSNTSTFATPTPVTETSNFIVTTTNATGAGSLEQAILRERGCHEYHAVHGHFRGHDREPPYTINLPSGGLTPIARPVVLDATSQTGYAGRPIIVLEGTGIWAVGLYWAPGRTAASSVDSTSSISRLPAPSGLPSPPAATPYRPVTWECKQTELRRPGTRKAS